MGHGGIPSGGTSCYEGAPLPPPGTWRGPSIPPPAAAIALSTTTVRPQSRSVNRVRVEPTRRWCPRSRARSPVTSNSTGLARRGRQPLLRVDRCRLTAWSQWHAPAARHELVGRRVGRVCLGRSVEAGLPLVPLGCRRQPCRLGPVGPNLVGDLVGLVDQVLVAAERDLAGRLRPDGLVGA